MRLGLLGSTLILSLILFSAVGQDDAPPPPSDGDKVCDVFVSGPSDWAVVSTDGKYLRRVRAVSITAELASKKASVTLESWDGPYRPAPSALVDKAVWTMRSLTVVSPEQFREIIDGGQAEVAAEVPASTGVPISPKK